MNKLKVVGVIALVLGVVFSVVMSLNPRTEVLREVVREVVNEPRSLKGATNYNRVGYGEDDVVITHGTFAGVLRFASGEGQENVLNDTGSMVMVNSVRLYTSGTASTSMRLYVGTSTSSTFNQVFNDRMNQLPPLSTFSHTLAEGWYLATGTSATSTSNWFLTANRSALNGTTTAAGDEGSELGLPLIRAGEYIHVVKKEASNSGEFSNVPCNAQCEEATSTNWGADVYYEIEWTATSSPTN